MHTPPSATITAALYFTDRLMERLAAVHERPMTLIEAPMGYGKTSAVREYLRRSGTRAIWTAVLSNGEESFWRDFCRSLATAVPQSADAVESLLRLGYPSDSVRVDAACELLEGVPFAGGTVLVVDDIHFLPGHGGNTAQATPDGPALAGSGGGRGMGMLCERLALRDAATPRIVLISRHTYPGSRELLALKGRLTVIDRDIFALEQGEIRDYYARCGVRLSDSDAATLHKLTGGWISALYLYLLSFKKHGVLARPAAINTLLEKEIYEHLSPATRELLPLLYPLERFSAAQAAFLYGRDASGALAELSEKNAFINYDEASGTYALHSIFRQYLKDIFDRLPADRRRGIHSTIADWLVRHSGPGEAFTAIEACCAAGEFERALQVLESDMSRNLVTERSRFFVDLFKTCPQEMLQRHMGAAFKYAIALFTAGDFAAFGEQLGWISRQCAARPENDPEAREWRGESEFLLSLAAYNDIAAMSVHHRRANELLGHPTRLFGPESPWTLGSPSVLFMFHRESGKLDEEIRLMHECLPHYYTLASMHGAGGEYLLQAEALYNRGEFQEASIVCHQAQAMAQTYGQLGNVLCALFLHMRLRLARRTPDGYAGAGEIPARMLGLISDRRDFFQLHTVDLCKGYLYASLGLADAVPAWLQFSETQEQRLYTFAGGFYYIVHGKALLAAGQHAALLGLFSWLLKAGPFARNLLFTIYARIYTAAAGMALGRHDEALAALEAALELALPDRLYMPFAENSAHLDSLLRSPGLANAPGEDIRRIRELGAAWEKNRKHILRAEFGSAGSPLTARELELARLAVQGKKYKEIAESLHIAPSTVKKAFSVIYRKLGISSRAELRSALDAHMPPGNASGA